MNKIQIALTYWNFGFLEMEQKFFKVPMFFFSSFWNLLQFSDSANPVTQHKTQNTNFVVFEQNEKKMKRN